MNDNDSSTPVLDLKEAMAAIGDDPEIYEAVLESYREDSPNLFAAMETAAAEGDWTAFSRHAHSLKSSSRTIGGFALGLQAEEVEHRSANGPVDDAPVLVARLKEHYDKLMQALNQEGY